MLVKNYWWYIAGTYLLIVNITRAIWLIVTDSWLNILWLSQIIGCIEAGVIFTRTRLPILNGFYLAVSFFPFLGIIIFLPIGTDILFWLNHIPHIFLFYFFLHKEKIATQGFNISVFFLMVHLNLTWFLQYYFNSLSMAINTTTSPYFPIVIGIGLIWYLFLFYTFSSKSVLQKKAALRAE